jgi:cytochrome P450
MGDQAWFYLVSLSSVFLCFFLYKKLFTKTDNKNLPPGPPSWPIIGHLHLIKVPVHRTLQKFSYTYGPIFSLKFGSHPVIVVSSPQLLEECFSKNDIVFANRPHLLVGKHLGYNDTGLAFAAYGPHWRNLRRVTTLKFFSTNRLNAFQHLRREEAVYLVKDLFNASRSAPAKVEMKDRLLALSFNSVMRMATGKRYFGTDVENFEEAEKFRGIICDIFEASGAGNPNDFIKFLRWIDFKGSEKKFKSLQERTDFFLQKILDEIRDQRKATGVVGQTLMDELLDFQEAEPAHYTDTLIKANISTILLAGTDTSSSNTEWALALLFNHPEVLKKAKEEIETNIGYDRFVEESDMSKLPYVQCIVNESLRIQPVSPLLCPHLSSEDCVIGGYHIARGTMLLPNAWALNRDPKVWDDPTSFKPERFQGTKIGAYQFMPFGMGRRQCPGNTLANRVVNHSLAALIQCFEWERETEELIDMTEGLGITMPIKKPLEAICKPRKEMLHILTKF